MKKSTSAQIYGYYSPYGLFTIRKLIDSDHWLLFLDQSYVSHDGQAPSTWPTADAVADAVFRQRTGFDIWDRLHPVVYPATLDDWSPLSALGETTLPRTKPGP